jgi:thiopeptide-type bacteriocin biosynthesis domain
MTQRRYIIGEEWIYLKVYTGPMTIETILVNNIENKLNQFFLKKIIDKFFFIRYMDPEYHIRIRLHCANLNYYSQILFEIHKSLHHFVKNLIITKVVWDTYSRELERYDNNHINLFEDLFYYDSSFILKYLKKTLCSDNERYLVSMKFIDGILSSIGMNLDQKLLFTTNSAESYLNELYRSNSDVKHLLNLKYRKDRTLIENCLDTLNSKVWWQVCLHEYLSKASNLLKIIFKGKTMELTSIIHMHVNRMFRTNQRTCELVIYWYLSKYYKSKKAKLKYTHTSKY